MILRHVRLWVMPVFTANIPSVLNIGDRIEIAGKIRNNARKMSINLSAEEGEEPLNVVLHFDVRFRHDHIVSLSRRNGVWLGSGSHDTNYNMFVPGTLFRIVFEMKGTDLITIFCQGKFHSNFLPKVPLRMARFVVAWSDIERVTHCYIHSGKSTSACRLTHAAEATGPPQPRPPAPRTAALPGKGPPPPVPLYYVPYAPRDEMGHPNRLLKPRPRDWRGSPKEEVTSPSVSDSESSETTDSSLENNSTTGKANQYFYDRLMCAPCISPKPQHRAKYAGRKRRESGLVDAESAGKKVEEGRIFRYRRPEAAKAIAGDAKLAKEDEVVSAAFADVQNKSGKVKMTFGTVGGMLVGKGKKDGRKKL